MTWQYLMAETGLSTVLVLLMPLLVAAWIIHGRRP